MFYKRAFLSLSGSFTAGFSLAYWLHNKENKFQILNAAAVPSQPKTDLVPFNPSLPAKYATDDLAVSKAARVGEIMKHGYPSLENLRIFEDYVLAYDRRTRVPQWVFEHLTQAKLKSLEDTDRGKSEFKEDLVIHPYFRSTNNDYKGSGYDRGHMAAAANHRMSQLIMDQTFFLSNMAPQVGVGFNRDKWNDLEKEVRGLVKKNDNVWVVTGPLYLPHREPDGKMYVKYEVIGNQQVAVPTHFFKVVVTEKSGQYGLLSYVLPNAPCDKGIPLNNYLVPLDSIERAAGFLLFDRLPRNTIKSINK